MTINNKIGWLVIVVVVLVIAFFVYHKGATPEGEGMLGTPKKAAPAPNGGQAPGAPAGGQASQPTSPGTGGGLVVFFPSR